jgi:hypothetical protein
MADEALGFLTLYELAECMHTRQVSPPENSSGHPSVTRQRYRLPQPACGPCRIATQQDMARHCERAVAAGGGKPEASGGSGGAKIPFGLPILISHGLRYPVNVRQVTAAWAHAPP